MVVVSDGYFLWDPNSVESWLHWFLFGVTFLTAGSLEFVAEIGYYLPCAASAVTAVLNIYELFFYAVRYHLTSDHVYIIYMALYTGYTVDVFREGKCLLGNAHNQPIHDNIF